MDPRLTNSRFPRSRAYHPEWIIAGTSGGANPLWLTEWLCTAMDLRSGMRVLNLGCAWAMSSIFLKREFNVQVWGTDLWFSASENLQRIRDAGVEYGVLFTQTPDRFLPLFRNRSALSQLPGPLRHAERHPRNRQRQINTRN